MGYEVRNDFAHLPQRARDVAATALPGKLVGKYSQMEFAAHDGEPTPFGLSRGPLWWRPWRSVPRRQITVAYWNTALAVIRDLGASADLLDIFEQAPEARWSAREFRDRVVDGLGRNGGRDQ